MAKYRLDKLIDSKWIEQEIIICEGRRRAIKKIMDKYEGQNLKNGCWKLCKVSG